MLTLEEIAQRLADHRPEQLADEDRRRAAVAMVLREDREHPGRPELLFIERARHDADPWSGHMAFPGGRVEHSDPSERDAAERETEEEVGISLDGTRYLGRLDDLEGRHSGRPAGLIISAHVYSVEDPTPLAINYEVEEAFWFPVHDLHDPERHVEYRMSRTKGMKFPGILVGDPERHVVWGLTYRFLELFFAAVGKPLPVRWK